MKILPSLSTISINRKQMTSINDSLSQDLLFKIFKLLDSMEIVLVQSTCKQWSDIINLHGSFWRSLNLPDPSLVWHRQIAELFDENFGSSLTEVDVRINMYYREASEEEDVEDEQDDRDDQQHLLRIILNSRLTLNYLLLICEKEEEDGERTFGGFSLRDFLDHFPNLGTLRLSYLQYFNEKRSVCLRFDSNQIKSLDFNLFRFSGLFLLTAYSIALSTPRKGSNI